MKGRTVLFEQRTQGITQAGKWSVLGWDLSIISDCTLQEDKSDWELSARPMRPTSSAACCWASSNRQTGENTTQFLCPL